MLLVAFLAANWPFLTNRLFGVMTLAKGKQPFWILLELVVLYFLIGGLGRILEASMGPVHHQGWQFYVVTICLFLVFAFPGYVYRFLWPRSSSDV
ncbi:MAG TPA: DUF2818 family protein [Burkholderiales bacterium]|nr:DUF2818 family protein [Burkholderiales bacterium]